MKKNKFVPDEVWILPAKRSSEAEPESGKTDEKMPAPMRPEREPPDEGRGRILLQAGFGLCVSFVVAACGARDPRPHHVGPALGDTHVSQAPSDPTVPPPDAADYEQPSPGYEITPPIGPSPNLPPPAQEPAPAPPPQPGAFAPPPPPPKP